MSRIVGPSVCGVSLAFVTRPLSTKHSRHHLQCVYSSFAVNSGSPGVSSLWINNSIASVKVCCHLGCVQAHQYANSEPRLTHMMKNLAGLRLAHNGLLEIYVPVCRDCMIDCKRQALSPKTLYNRIFTHTTM